MAKAEAERLRKLKGKEKAKPEDEEDDEDEDEDEDEDASSGSEVWKRLAQALGGLWASCRTAGCLCHLINETIILKADRGCSAW